jgi:radical SAM superfamily enzyme YgiQ (UPF0313 family)
MRILLIHVRDPQFYGIPEAKRSEAGRVRIIGFPPIGIMSLSAVLKRAGHECVMFDQANPETPNETILEEIHRQKPDLVGLSFLSGTSYPYAKILARQIRARDSGVRIAFGGVFVTLNANRVKQQCPEVDFVCRGDGEDLILDLLDHLDNPSTVAGVTWAESDGQVRENLARPLERNLDRWPFPDREGLAIDYIESMPLDVPAVLSFDRYTTMQTSRGCPWPCVFCDIPIFSEGKWRSRSASHVVEELKQLDRDGYRSVFFVDDHFLLNPKRIESMCDGINENHLKIRWGSEGRVDSKCMDLFPTMVKANIQTLMFGIESGSQKILDRLKKGQSLEQIETAVTAAKKAGIEIVHGFFLLGNPDETVDDIRKTYEFASRLRIDTFGFGRLCVYRGTPLWKEYVQRGLVDDEEDWNKYQRASWIDPTVLPDEEIDRVRSDEMRRLILYKFTRRPLQSLKVLRRFLRHMPIREVLRMVFKPFLRKKEGATKAEGISQAMEHEKMKKAAADLTQISEDALENAVWKRENPSPETVSRPPLDAVRTR